MILFRSFLAFLLCLCAVSLYAQFDPTNSPSGFNFNGIIKGTVVDTLTKKPVEYAAVSAMAVKDSTIAGGMVTDEAGNFLIDKLKPGRYILRIKFIGYSEKIIRGISLKPGSELYVAGQIYILAADQNLQEVEIVSHVEVMEANLDKRIVNVEKDLTSVGGTALDVMKNVPSVQVDMDNNVSLRGNSNVRILIDGKISTLDPSTLLLQIPASMVKQIEVITNPSAKYDPDGVSGIINVITKKERKPGFNAIITGGIGSGSNAPGGGIDRFMLNKYNFNTSMNYQTGKFNFYGSYDARYGQSWNTGYNYRELYRNDSTFILNQNSGRLRPVWNNSGKAGMDISFNDKNILSVSGNLRAEKSTPFESINYFEYLGTSKLFLNEYQRNNDEKSGELSYDGNANYKKMFARKGHELVFDGTYSNTQSTRTTQISESYFNNLGEIYKPDSVLETINERNYRQNISSQIDYVNPTEKHGRFEAGAKYLGRINQQQIETFTNKNTGYTYKDTNRTNTFRYRDNILAAYIIYANQFKKIKYQGGLRFEQALTNSYQVTLDTLFTYNYRNIFPTVHLKYVPKEENEFSFSYSKRINRPGNGQLNPYPDYSDRQNYRIGNPYLKPEYVHSFELAYGKFNRNLSYTATLFYRNTQNSFYRIKKVDEITGIGIITFANISQSHSAGVEFTYNQTVNKWMRVNGNASAFYYLLQADNTYRTPQTDNFSYTGRASFNFTLSKTFETQVSVNYRGPQVTPQGTILPTSNVDIGLKKELFNKRASLGFKFSDIFNYQQFRIQASDYNYTSTVRFKRESRVANLSFTWKINQGVEKKEKPRSENNGGGDIGM